MQGNGFKLFLIAAFLGLCGYYLYPSVQNYFITQEIESLQGEAREAYKSENAGRIRAVRDESLKLGLDLQGGMHVTLQVQTAALIGELAEDRDATFNEVLEAARARVQENDGSVIDAFVEIFEERDPNARLSRYFRSEEAGIGRRSTNEEVADYLRAEADEAVGRAIEIIRSRVDRYGVTEPSIQRQGERRIVVELPGIDEPERVRNLLKGTARLEFRLMADPQRLAQSAQRIVSYYEGRTGEDGAEALTDTTALPQPAAPGDTAAMADHAAGDTTEGAALVDPTDEDTAEDGQAAGSQLFAGADEAEADAGPQNPLLEVMQPLPYGPQNVAFGQVLASDTARANALLSRPEVQELLPANVELMYDATPVGLTEGGEEAFALKGVREEIELTGDMVTDAAVEFDQMTNQARVSMTMNSEGARLWSRLTGANVNRPVAIILDNAIVSDPNVEERITGGVSSITGLGGRAEAQDIVTVLKSGALPAPLDIVEERTVGPSLGAESIRAGFTSVLVGLLLVALFMIFFYRTAGVVADVALLLNVILILGILAGFNATLTLPGIAGIVLTIGMAVDANVLIFERIREEQATGKTLRAAIDAGYQKALSAILDANITTFFVGAILFSFGVGPIQGFAVTLMAGILSSLFTAIIVTRVIFDYMIQQRGMEVSYG